jgi:hypothetical protein
MIKSYSDSQIRKIKIEDESSDTEMRSRYKELMEPVLSLLKTGSISIVTITGLSLAAVFAFSGAVWANPSTPMLQICADALRGSGIAFALGMLTFLLESFTQFTVRMSLILPKIRKTRDFISSIITIFFIVLAMHVYVYYGVSTLIAVYDALHIEAKLFNNEGTVKSAAPPAEPGELKPLGEFRPPDWLKK